MREIQETETDKRREKKKPNGKKRHGFCSHDYARFYPFIDRA